MNLALAKEATLPMNFALAKVADAVANVAPLKFTVLLLNVALQKLIPPSLNFALLTVQPALKDLRTTLSTTRIGRKAGKRLVTDLGGLPSILVAVVGLG